MLKTDQIGAAIMAEVQKEVTAFLDKVNEEKPAGVTLEMQARELGQRCGAILLGKAMQLYGPGHEGQSLPCHCAEGEGTMRFIRYDRKHFITAVGRIEVRSAYYHCSQCRSSRWPAFEQLGLGPGALSEGARRMASYAAAVEGGFERSSELVKRLAGLDLSASTLLRVSEQLGHQIQQLQKAEVERAFKAEGPAAGQKVKLLHLASDGTLVQTDTGWREVKSGVVYEVVARPGKEPQAVRASYVSSFEKAEEFGKELWAESARRGAGWADRIVVLGDGAAWVWHQAALHYPNNRVEVLDFYHASEHLGLVAKAYYGETSPTGAHWHQKQAKRLLARGGAKRVLQVLKRMPAKRAEVQEVIKDNLRYFENNLERMNYSEYRKRGYHIGSGLAESACKHLVGKRLKQSGMTNWSEPGAEAILRLRVVIENGRFDQYCDQVSRQRLQQAA